MAKKIDIQSYEYDPFKKAADENLDVVLPQRNELQIDIDDAHQFVDRLGVYETNLEFLKQLGFPLIEHKRTVSKSGNGYHIYVLVNQSADITPLERSYYQALLGSDLKREIFTLKRIQEKYPHPTLFFETKPPAPSSVMGGELFLSDDDLPF